MLSRIVALLAERGVLTVDELVRATGVSRTAMEGMLDTLQRRRMIVRRRGETGLGCDGCRFALGEADPHAPTVTLEVPQKIRPPAVPGAKGQPKPGEGRGKTGRPAGQSSRK